MRTNALVFAAFLSLAACGPEVDTTTFLVEDGLELHQGELHVGIVCEEPVDCVPAMRAWERWLGQPAFLLRLDGIGGYEVSVVEGELPPEVYGEAALLWHPDTGEIVSCDVTLQAREWWPEVLEHELGHCLGLADVDYSIGGSIMSVPTWGGAGLTCGEACADAVLEALDE